MSKLVEADRWTLREVRRTEVGVFGDARGRALDQSRGVRLVTCIDPWQFSEIFDFHRRLARKQVKPVLIEPYPVPAGGLRFASGSPLLHPNELDHLLTRLRENIEHTGILDTVLYAHAPCRATTRAGVNLEQALEFLFQAERTVCREIPGVKVACFSHIDFGSGKKRSYHLSRKRWEAWRAQRH